MNSQIQNKGYFIINSAKSIIIFALILTFTFSLNPALAQLSVGISSDMEVSAEELDIHMSGDWHNEGYYTATDAKLVFVDGYEQYIFQKNNQLLSYLEINKTGGSVILGKSLIISDTLSLLSGNVIAVDTAYLTLTSIAGINGGSDSSFIDGPFSKALNVSALSLFQFPAGAGQDYRPITVEFSDITGDSIIVMTRQINESAQNLSTEYVGIDKVSSVRYWKVEKSGPGTFSSANVTFSYDTTVSDDGVEIASELRIAHLQMAGTWTWAEMEESNTATEDYQGTINSGPITDFGSGYFAFGDAAGGADISLPVLLSNFELSEKRGDVAISWRSESEINNLKWLLQRKEEVDTTAVFETIAVIEGQGTMPSATEYTAIDNSADVGREYSYRLADISFSGRIHYHDAQTILVGLPKNYELFQNYPNPFNPRTTILYNLPVISNVQIDIYNILGQKVTTLVKEKQKAGYYKISWNSRNRHGNNVASGMYVLSIRASSLKEGKKENFAKVKKMMIIK